MLSFFKELTGETSQYTITSIGKLKDKYTGHVIKLSSGKPIIAGISNEK